MPRESCGGELVRADQRGKYGQVEAEGRSSETVELVGLLRVN